MGPLRQRVANSAFLDNRFENQNATLSEFTLVMKIRCLSCDSFLDNGPILFLTILLFAEFHLDAPSDALDLHTQLGKYHSHCSSWAAQTPSWGHRPVKPLAEKPCRHYSHHREVTTRNEHRQHHECPT